MLACTRSRSRAPGGRLDEPDRPLDRADGSSSSPNVSASRKITSVSVDPTNVREQARLDGEHQVAAHLVEAGQDAVVDEQPAAVAERVAVGLLDRGARRRAHMREEQRRLDVAASSRRFASPQAGAML